MGKQALGIYMSNFNKRIDTMGNILNYPQKPLVYTKLSKYTKNYKGTAEEIAKRFENRGWKAIGEKGKVTPTMVKQIIEMSY